MLLFNMPKYKSESKSQPGAVNKQGRFVVVQYAKVQI